MTVRKASPRPTRGQVRSWTPSSNGLVTERRDGTIYHQDRMRWDSSKLGTFRHPTHEDRARDDG